MPSLTPAVRPNPSVRGPRSLYWLALVVYRATQGINDIHEGEPAKIGVPCADSTDAVLAHDDCCVQVMGKIATSIWVFRCSLGEHSRVTGCCREDLEARR